MIDSAHIARSLDWRTAPEQLRTCLLGFVYWLCLLLVLEPGNLLNASEAGVLPSFSHEAIRIGVAALLGAMATAIPALLTKKMPMAGATWPRRALIHSASACTLALVLILVSCLLAAWVLQGKALPTVAEVRDQLVGNWLLLTYALGALTAILHAVERSKTALSAPAPTFAPAFVPDQPAAAAPPASTREGIQVKVHGNTHVVELGDIEWIEAQGNYVALHTAAGTHLVRGTLSALQRQLDPACFVRIHRRVVVPVNRITSIKPVGNGDAVLSLADGNELRVSRNYRDALKSIRTSRERVVGARPSA
jgi:hypothetical protein